MKIKLYFAAILFLLFSCSKHQPNSPSVVSFIIDPVEKLDTAFISNMKWRNVGPHRGGRSLAVAGSPTRKFEYYFGAVGGGLWKTTDGGTNWKPVTDGQLKSSSVGAVAVAETNPDVIYIGMGETELRGNIMQGDGVYKSEDAGKSWKHMGLEETHAIAVIRVHPKNENILYVAALGHPYGKNEQRGVFRSKDGGQSWEKVLYVGDDAGAIDLVMDRNNPNVIYASTWQVYRTPWKMWGGGEKCGLYKSSNGGDTWEPLIQNEGMPEGPIGKIGVTVSPANSNRVWAIVEANEGGLFRSDNAGKTWEKVNDERKLRQRAFYYSRIFADPKDENTVYGLNVDFWKSTDGGKTFDVELHVPHGDNHDMWIDPTDPLRMINGNDGGGTVSVNGGKSWTDYDFPTAQLYHIMTTNDFPYFICGAQQDNSTLCIPSEGWGFLQARGPASEYYFSPGGGESGYIAQHPDKPNVFFAGSQGALLTRFDKSTGHIRDVQVSPRFFSGEPSDALPERWQWTFPIVFSPVDHNKLYTCSQHVWVSEDEGQSWKKISPDLTLADPETLGPTGGIITKDMNGPEIYATVFSLAPSFQDVNTIWAGSDDGLVHITRDHGENWTNITPPDMPKHTRVSVIDASKHDQGTAYIAGKRYQMDDRKPYIWRTHDFGQTWKLIVKGIREDDYIHAVREDPYVPGLLYAAGEHQVWVSFDDGENWHSLQINMPDTQIADLSVTEKDLVAGTHGRSIWILDDIAPLREYREAILEEKARLLKPYYAVRRVQDATIQYYLPEQADSVIVEIIDHTGSTVIKKTGTKPKIEEKEGSSWFGRNVKDPTTAKGLNTWIWNGRHEGAKEFKGMIIWSARPQLGPWAVPGKYIVKVTANGESLISDFDLKQDPRIVGISIADMQKQFDLAMQIRNATDTANKVIIAIRERKTRLDSTKHMFTGEDLKNIEITLKQLSDVEQKIYQVQNQSPQDPLNFPIKVNNRLAYLRKSVESGDGPPTAGAYEVFDQLKQELDEYIKEYHSITRGDGGRGE
ncbi:MAG: glycosyl hydrolase [Cyclobacteriaceae bacterium]|nr:glycosyl hydrolase [Cyclobacteriaceae bacterium]